MAEMHDLVSAINRVASELKYLGNGNGVDPNCPERGAIEALGMVLKESGSGLEEAVVDCGDKIEASLDCITNRLEDISSALDKIVSALESK